MWERRKLMLVLMLVLIAQVGTRLKSLRVGDMSSVWQRDGGGEGLKFQLDQRTRV